MGNIVEIVDIEYKGVWAEKGDPKELVSIFLSNEEIQAVRELLSEPKTLYVGARQLNTNFVR